MKDLSKNPVFGQLEKGDTIWVYETPHDKKPVECKVNSVKTNSSCLVINTTYGDYRAFYLPFEEIFDSCHGSIKDNLGIQLFISTTYEEIEKLIHDNDSDVIEETVSNFFKEGEFFKDLARKKYFKISGKAKINKSSIVYQFNGVIVPTKQFNMEYNSIDDYSYAIHNLNELKNYQKVDEKEVYAFVRGYYLDKLNNLRKEKEKTENTMLNILSKISE